MDLGPTLLMLCHCYNPSMGQK